MKFMHPAEIERFKQMFLPVLRVEAVPQINQCRPYQLAMIVQHIHPCPGILLQQFRLVAVRPVDGELLGKAGKSGQ